jgi:hypothetical protein
MQTIRSSVHKGGGQPHRRRAAAAAVLAAMLAVAGTGCDDPVASGRAPEAAAAYSAAEPAVQPRFHPNRLEYRNTSAKPAVGRAGSATLTGNVLLDVTGRAQLYLAAGATSGGSPVLEHVQVKAYDAGGRLLFTRNEAPGPGTRRATYDLGGIGRDARVSVQANVSGADRARTGVVTMDVPVRLRPDLQVAAVAAPARVALRTMVGISATIRELNGDFGARAHCALYVDDVEVDRAWGIWVDAGSSVSCAFRHYFGELGERSVEVRLLDVEPADFNPANNSASTVVDVQLIPSAFSYAASFQDASFEHFSRSEYRSQSADGRFGWSGRYEDTSHGREQQAILWAWTPRTLAFPLNELVIRQSTRDEVVHNAHFLDVQPDYLWEYEGASQACFMRWFETVNGNHTFEMCSVQYVGWEPYTYISYSRYAGDVTYHSRGDSRWWDLDAGYDDAWSWNHSFTWQTGRMASYGREYGFYIWMQDVNGTYRMQPLVWLQPFTEEMNSPRSCWDFADEWWSYMSCYESRSLYHGLREHVDGWRTY